MNEIAKSVWNNSRRHFIVWGLILCVFKMAPMFATDPTATRPVVKDSPEYQISQCVAANDDPIKYALIQRINSGAERVTSDRLIGKALDDALAGKDWKNVRVLAFCK